MSGWWVHRETWWRFHHNHQSTRFRIHLLAIISCDGLIARFTVMLPSVPELLKGCAFFLFKLPFALCKKGISNCKVNF